MKNWVYIKPWARNSNLAAFFLSTRSHQANETYLKSRD